LHERGSSLVRRQDLHRARGEQRAYPRRTEFVDEPLPKTLTGKIRRIELREAERERASA